MLTLGPLGFYEACIAERRGHAQGFEGFLREVVWLKAVVVGDLSRLA
jgi:hypothetical protein